MTTTKGRSTEWLLRRLEWQRLQAVINANKEKKTSNSLMAHKRGVTKKYGKTSSMATCVWKTSLNLLDVCNASSSRFSLTLSPFLFHFLFFPPSFWKVMYIFYKFLLIYVPVDLSKPPFPLSFQAANFQAPTPAHVSHLSSSCISSWESLDWLSDALCMCCITNIRLWLP